MEKEQKIEIKPVEKVNGFRKKIKALNDPNFNNIDLGVFEEEDMDIFNKVEEGILTRSEYEDYKKKLVVDDSPESKAKSALLGCLGNRIMASGLIEKWDQEAGGEDKAE